MSAATAPGRTGLLAVALHDVEPATFERCALIRDWLYDHGVGRATLLVIPAADLHPFSVRRPELTTWLHDQHQRGDAVAQHGFQHRQLRAAGPLRQRVAHWQGGNAAEFAGLDRVETRTALLAGRRLLELAGIDPHGFVAPAYAYTSVLHEELAEAYDWWAGLMRCYRRCLGVDEMGGAQARGERRVFAPALCLGTSTAAKRTVSPLAVRAGSLLAGRTLRLDLHPADFANARHVRALEWTLRRAKRRDAITYDELLGA